MVLQVETKNATFGSMIEEEYSNTIYQFQGTQVWKLFFELFLVLDISKILMYPLKHLS